MSKGILFDHRSQDFYSFYIYSSPPTTKSTFYIYNIYPCNIDTEYSSFLQNIPASSSNGLGQQRILSITFQTSFRVVFCEAKH